MTAHEAAHNVANLCLAIRLLILLFDGIYKVLKIKILTNVILYFSF